MKEPKRLTYKELANKNREVGGRAPKFETKYFSKKEVREALENNRHFTHICVDLGLMRKGSKSPFNALRNLHRLLSHFGLSTKSLGSNLLDEKREVECPYCKGKVKIN